MVSANVGAARVRLMFKGPGQQVNGLEAVPEGLWLCDQRDNRCYLVDFEGRVLSSFPSPVRNASGITFGAGSVWVASNTRPALIFRHALPTGQCTAFIALAGDGGVHGLQWRPYGPGEQPPPPPEAGPELYPSAPAGRLNAGPGVSGTIWVSRPGGHRIEHLDAETGDLLGTVHFEPSRSHGMFWDESDGTLNVAETNGGHIFRIDPKSSEVLEEWRVDGSEVHGLTRSPDGRVWIGDAATNEILVVEP